MDCLRYQTEPHLRLCVCLVDTRYTYLFVWVIPTVCSSRLPTVMLTCKGWVSADFPCLLKLFSNTIKCSLVSKEYKTSTVSVFLSSYSIRLSVYFILKTDTRVFLICILQSSQNAKTSSSKLAFKITVVKYGIPRQPYVFTWPTCLSIVVLQPYKLNPVCPARVNVAI